MLIECEHEGFFPLNLSKAVIYLPITKIKKIRLFVDNTNKEFFFFSVNIKFKLQKFFFTQIGVHALKNKQIIFVAFILIVEQKRTLLRFHSRFLWIKK